MNASRYPDFLSFRRLFSMNFIIYYSPFIIGIEGFLSVCVNLQYTII